MTVSCSKLGALGRMGNQCFQLASSYGLSRSKGCDLVIPYWKYSQFFKGPIPEGNPRGTQIKEPAFHYCGDFIPNDRDYDVVGYLQSRKYWQHCEKEVREMLAWEPKFLARIRQKYANTLSRETVAIHVRRGDYVGHEGYINLPPTYYFSALEKHFPDWRNGNLLVFSDDKNYARLHFDCIENAYFPDGDEISDLCLMSQCDGLVMANSSYSFWGAYLGKDKKVVRPTEYFAGSMANTHSTKDLYPPEWIPHNTEKINLKDVTFTIPIHRDHNDRKHNLDLTVCMLQRHFDCEIIVMEQGGNHFKYFSQWCRYIQFDEPRFRRTEMLNKMAQMSTTRIICNYDADIIIPPLQMLKAIEILRNGADMVFPYDGRFARMSRTPWFKKLERSLDIGIAAGESFSGMKESDNRASVGGCVLFNKQSFLDGGGENERIVIWGPEDAERDFRFRKLGFSVERVNGCLFHIDHFVGPNSGNSHPYVKSNHAEWQKVQGMNRAEMWEYVKSWPWYSGKKNKNDNTKPAPDRK